MTKNKVNSCLHMQETAEKSEDNAFPAIRSGLAVTSPCAQSQTLISQE